MSRFLQATLFLSALATPAAAAGPYDDLLKSVPPGTNALALINVKAAYASPLAKTENWAGDHYKRYQSGVAFVPPEAEVVAIATDLNLSTMARASQFGLVKLRNGAPLPEIAKREGGTLGDINGRLTVLSPRDVYYTSLPGAGLAAVYPADRQAAARWIKYAVASKSADLSPYLKQAADAAGDSTLVIALDLTDAVEPAILKLALAASPAVVKNKVADLTVLNRVAASVKGVTLSVTATDKLTAAVRVDFGADPTLYKKAIRDMFLELIDDYGVSIAGMDGWETTYTNTAMTLTGDITGPDLRRLFSLFAFPGLTPDDGAAEEANAGATKRYLAAVEVVLTDLTKRKDSPDYTKTATWHDKAAEQIDHLSRRGVDPTAVTAGQESAKRLRAIASSLRGVPINQDALTKMSYYNSSSTVGASVGWGGIRPVYLTGGNVQTNYPEIRTKMAQVISEDQSKRSESWTQIAQIMSDAKNALEAKYKTKF